MTADQVFIAEKFAPCPECRCYSLEIVKGGKPTKKQVSARTWFTCNNCGYRFSARITKDGDTLKTVAIWDRAFVIKNIILATLAAAALIFLAIKLPLWKGTPAAKPAIVKEQKPKVDKTGDKKSKPAAKPVTRKKAKKVIAKQQDKQEQTLLQPATPEDNKDLKTEKSEPVKEKSLSMEITPKQEAAKPQTALQENTIKPTSTKIYDLSYMKVRRSYPNSSDPSHRWFFNKRTVVIKRSSEQRVFIAGDERGRRAWAVDDEIRINGQRIKGFSEEITEIGVIPHSAKVPPHDITALVPVGGEVTLDIRLVDYGIFWGNTPIYIVVK